MELIFYILYSIGVSVTSSNSGVPDISGTVYNKTQVVAPTCYVFWFDILNEFEGCEGVYLRELVLLLSLVAVL